MKILTDKLYLSVVGIVVVLLVTVAYLFAQVLDQPLTSRPKVVNVELAQTGGLYEGSSVTYRGIKVGKVGSIRPSPTGVIAEVSLTSGTDIPKDSMARVRSLSPVGEQYLDFQPNTESGPFIDDGETIPATSTDIPQSLSSTVVAINNVLRQIDDKKLKTVLGELSTGLKGTGDDLGMILDQGTEIIDTLDAIWPETDRLITNADTVLSIPTDEADSLRQLATSSKQFARFLKNQDPLIRRTLKNGPAQLAELTKLVQELDRILPGFLGRAVSLTDILAAYDPHLRALLQNYKPGLQSLINKLAGGELRVAIIPDKARVCKYGNVTRLNPQNNERRELQQNGHCPASFETLMRGAAHAPGPVR